MLNAILVTVWVTLCGAALTYAWDQKATLGARLASGVVLGLTVWGFTGYLVASLLSPNGMTAGAQIASALPLALGFIPLFLNDNLARLRWDVQRLRGAFRPRLKSRGRWIVRIGFIVAALILVPCLRGALYEQDGGWFISNPFNYGDLPWHLAIVEGFAHGNNFPPQHPEFAGSRLTYPFLVDFTTAQYEVLGMSVPAAFLLQNLTLAYAFLVLGIRWVLIVTRRPVAVAIAPLLWMLSGGWGFYLLAGDMQQWSTTGQKFAEFFLHLPRDYTRDMAGAWSWGNSMTCLITTQRGLFQAFPLAFIVLTLLWQTFRDPERVNGPTSAGRTRLLWAGAVTGLLPLVHGHTILSLVLIAVGLALLDLKPFSAQRFADVALTWIPFFIVAGILAAPQAGVLAQGSNIDKERFFGWQPGWDCQPGENWLLFWIRNTGPLVPLLIAAFVTRTRAGNAISGRLRTYYAPFLLCFVLPNLFRFAPWVWDNIKILVYWFLGSTLIVARYLAFLTRRGVMGTIAAAVLLFLCIFAGGLDVWKLVSFQRPTQVFSPDDLRFAQLVRDKVPTGSILMHSPLHNHPVLLGGRPVASGYPGHLWSHGLNFGDRQEQVKRIYAGAPDADALLATLKINFIVIGPPERRDTNLVINDAYLSKFPLVGEAGGYQLRQVP